MKTMRSVLTLFLTLALVAGTLTGCGKNSLKSETEENTAAQNASQEQETEEISPQIADSWYTIFQLFQQTDHSVYYAVKVENPDKNHYWNNVTVLARLLDADGNELGTSTAFIPVLEPGASQATVEVASCETKPASVEFSLKEDRLSASAEAPEDYITADKFEISDIVTGEKSYGDTCSLTGKLKNLSDKKAESLKYTILFTKDGKIVGAVMDYEQDLEAGAAKDIDTLADYCEYDNYEAYFRGTAPAAQ